MQKGNPMQLGWNLSRMKEIVLSLLALLWGVLFLFPGDVLSQASRLELTRAYAGDNSWGILLIIVGIVLLFAPRHHHLIFRRVAHALLWLFWLGIGLLVMWRGLENGWQPTDLLLSSPYIAIAIVHGVFYMNLVEVR